MKKKTKRSAGPGSKSGRPATASPKTKKGAGAMKMDSGTDIIQLILEDHKPLKKLIKILKDADKSLAERKKAFEQFAPLLLSHAKPEEQSLYVEMKKDEDERVEALEGDVEHQLADQMVQSAQTESDRDLWSAKVKVLAELVEHHIEEEEDDMLPDYKKHSTKEERVALGQKYAQLKMKFEESHDMPEAKSNGRDLTM